MITPEVGMGITIAVGSDRYAGTIVEVSPTGKRFYYREDKAIRVDKRGPFTELQDYRFEPDTNAGLSEARLTKTGWKHGGMPVHVGSRRFYRDPSY